MTVQLDSLDAKKTGLRTPSEELFFDINAKLEEQKKSNDQVDLAYELDITTKPNVVRYVVSGTVKLEGSNSEIKKKLEVNPKTKIPQILFAVYQHLFSSIYILSSILDTPYPPPDLLHPMQEKIQIISGKNEALGPQKEGSVKDENEPAEAPAVNK